MAAYDRDLEAAISFDKGDEIELSGGPSLTSLGFTNQTKLKARSSTGATIQSNRSNRTQVLKSFTLRVLSKFTSNEVEEELWTLSAEEEEARNEFFAIILGDCQGKDTNTDADADAGADSETTSPKIYWPPSDECAWFAKFLEAKFRNSWTSLLSPCLVGLKDNVVEPQANEVAVTYRFLAVTAELLTSRKNMTLTEIPDALENHKPHRMLKEQDNKVDKGERLVPHQLSFAAIGWLTLLYDPVLQPPSKQVLAIRKPTGRLPKAEVLRTRTITKYSQDFDQNDACLFMLIRKFGALMPFCPVVETGNDSSESDLIQASYVCYYMLEKVVNVKIEWVNSLSLHLEFDNQQRVLKVFRFPSYCLLMCQKSGDKTLLSQLYLDSRYLRKTNLEDPIEDRTVEYYKEILLSYRVIFGQDKRSWKAFNQHCAKWDDSWNRSNPKTHDSDPLLKTLCGSDWRSPRAKAVYAKICAPDQEPYYYPESDFPFLGTRLLHLQKFVRGRHPHDARALWYDRHNPAVWWTFWAVLFIGGGTLLLGILQLGFQIWSGWAAQKQVDLSQKPTIRRDVLGCVP